MKITFILLVLLLTFSIGNAEDIKTKNETKPTKTNWELVWEDNFDKDGLPNSEI